MSTENETELKNKLHKTLMSWGIIYTGKMLDEIMALITADKQRLLKELTEHATDYDLVTYAFGTAAVVGKDKAVPLSVIQNKLEGLS